MNASRLYCISPIDGRYAKYSTPLSGFFSEFGLIKYRLFVEIEYFKQLVQMHLVGLENFPIEKLTDLDAIVSEFSEQDAIAIKQIEATTNHDIKAVEYFIKSRFEVLSIAQYKEFVHFGLTSQDINNTAIPLSLKHGLEQVILPALDALMENLYQKAMLWRNTPMLAHTHGQPASPTTVGKEIMVFHERLKVQTNILRSLPIPAKFGGATGNFNAHHIAYPEIDWNAFADIFTQRLGLSRSYPTTQIEHYDNLAAIFDNLKRICTILIDLDRDFWAYISMEYFGQKVIEGEVGSSAMPHKVNPINFENSEGNAGIAVSFFEHLSANLPISRLQRDLSDSTVLRNIGVPIAHMLIAVQNTLIGLNKIELNAKAIEMDLEKNWVVVSEAVQTYLRTIGYPMPYEALKELTRTGKEISRQDMEAFIDKLQLSQKQKEFLKSITPFNYIGIV